jgi:hypothetical protein
MEITFRVYSSSTRNYKFLIIRESMEATIFKSIYINILALILFYYIYFSLHKWTRQSPIIDTIMIVM